MEPPYAEASCVLKVNVHCRACKMKMLEVLSSICGVYNVTIDSQKGLAKVSGVVNPNKLVRALTRTGYLADLKWINLRHPRLSRRYYSHDYNDYGYHNNGYHRGVLDDPYRSKQYLMDHSYPRSSRLSSDYPYNNRLSLPPATSRLSTDYPYDHQLSLPPASYVPSYPPENMTRMTMNPSVSVAALYDDFQVCCVCFIIFFFLFFFLFRSN